MRLDADLLGVIDAEAERRGLSRTEFLELGARNLLATEDAVSIYGLVDPRSGSLRYVGQSRDPERRLQGHLSGAGAGAKRKREWIQELRDEGSRPILVILDAAPPGQEADRLEFDWINRMNVVGDLTNERLGPGRRRNLTISFDADFIGQMDSERALTGVSRGVWLEELRHPSPMHKTLAPQTDVSIRAHRPNCGCPVCKPPKKETT